MCIREGYGNCDEETKDQEYCIFHKPNKSEEEAQEFYKKFLDRFKLRVEEIEVERFGKREKIKRFVFGDVDCRGYVFPEIPKGFDHFLFGFSVFEGVAVFGEVIFEGNVHFRWTTFKGDADFMGTIFEGYTYFRGTITEGGANFPETTFKKYVSFRGAIFKEGAYFSGVTFEGGAYFAEVTFEKIADFRYKKKDSEYKFYGELKFENAEFRKGVYIDIPSEWFRLPQAEAEACRVQRICYEKEGKKDDADRMFVRERRALRRKNVEEAKAKVKETEDKDEGAKSKLRAIWDLFRAYVSSFMEFLLADLTCEYGTNWQRPVKIWVPAVLFIFPLLYLVTKSVPNAYDFPSCLYFSIVTATTLGYGDLHPVEVGRALASAEAIFGTFMWGEYDCRKGYRHTVATHIKLFFTFAKSLYDKSCNAVAKVESGITALQCTLKSFIQKNIFHENQISKILHFVSRLGLGGGVMDG